MDLSTKYLGWTLPHPFLVGASPLCDDLDRVRELEDAGVAGFVLRSLFEEQIDREAVAHWAAEHPDQVPERRPRAASEAPAGASIMMWLARRRSGSLKRLLFCS